MNQFSKVHRTNILVVFLVIFAGAAQATSDGENSSAIDRDVNDLEWTSQTVDSNLLDISSSSADSKIDNVEFIDNIDDFKAANPNIELVEMTRIDYPAGAGSGPSPAAVRIYHLGRFTNGDRLTWAPNARNTFSSSINFQQNLNYRGPRLTYVEVVVDQSSNSGRAWFHSGGIGQGSAVVIIQALGTRHFHYQARFYGR